MTSSSPTHASSGFVATLAHLVRLTGRLVRGLFAAAVLAGLLAGVPWAAWHFVGWPLPHHMPTWEQIKTVLSQPASSQLVIDILACVCWLVWAAFAIDVARCTTIAVRTGRWPALAAPRLPGGPLQALAAALVGTIVLTLLGNRAASARGPAPDRPTAVPAAPVAGADLDGSRLPFAGPAPAAVPASHRLTTAAPRLDPALVPGRPWTVVVRPPTRGIHDSLWRIADRNLGDGARWPEIYRLNRGRLQPDGQRLLSPNLIYPGWRLTLPGHPTVSYPHAPHPPRHAPPHGHPRPPRTPHQPAPPRRTPSPTPHRPAPTSPQPAQGPGRSPGARPSPGIDLPGGAAVHPAGVDARPGRPRAGTPEPGVPVRHRPAHTDLLLFRPARRSSRTRRRAGGDG